MFAPDHPAMKTRRRGSRKARTWGTEQLFLFSSPCRCRPAVHETVFLFLKTSASQRRFATSESASQRLCFFLVAHGFPRTAMDETVGGWPIVVSHVRARRPSDEDLSPVAPARREHGARDFVPFASRRVRLVLKQKPKPWLNELRFAAPFRFAQGRKTKPSHRQSSTT